MPREKEFLKLRQSPHASSARDYRSHGLYELSTEQKR